LAALWASWPEADHQHDYIARKNGTPDGLRVVPPNSPIEIAGHRVAGWLAVPARSLDGTLRTVQLIPPEAGAGKLSWPGARFEDGMFIVGSPGESAVLYIAEGLATAWACWRATGHAAVVTFGCGRFDVVAGALRAKYRDKRLIIVPDRGKETQAAEVARHHNAEWVELPADKPNNYDACDFATEHDDEALAELLGTTKRPAQRFHLLTADELRALPAVRWRIHGVLPAEGIGAVYGPSASGKSFLLLDLLGAVARGAPWFDYQTTEACAVTYLAAEGVQGIPQRVRAHEQRHGKLPANFRAILTGLDLRSADDRAELVRAVKAEGQAGGIVVFDTLNRSAPGLDENDGAAMGEVIDALQKLQAELGGMVLAVAHTGKDAARGLRGHSSLPAALDASIEVQRDGDRRAWVDRKLRDGEDGKEHPFRLEVVDMGEDDYGLPATSCAVVRDEDAAELVRRIRVPQGGNQLIVWNALGELLRQSRDFGKGGAPASRPCLEVEAAVAAVRDKLATDPKRKTERTRLAITGLVAAGLLRIDGGWLWVA
jgi:hypothetical protein